MSKQTVKEKDKVVSVKREPLITPNRRDIFDQCRLDTDNLRPIKSEEKKKDGKK